MLQLLVEVAAQPRQLVQVTEVVGLHGLVELRGEGLVGGLVAVVAKAAVGELRPLAAPGLVASTRHLLLAGLGGLAFGRGIARAILAGGILAAHGFLLFL